MVVEDVPAFVRQVEIQTAMPAFGDSSNEMFGCVGDENGLLIVVKRGRLWLPDMRLAAREAPLAVQISEKGGRTFWLEGPPYHFRPA